MKVNVYDFDNTIYRGESLVDFILWYMRRDPGIWPHLPGLACIGIKDALHLFTVEQAVAAYAAFLESYYVKMGDLRESSVQFWDRHEKKIKPWYAAVRREDDIIISGTTGISAPVLIPPPVNSAACALWKTRLRSCTRTIRRPRSAIFIPTP